MTTETILGAAIGSIITVIATKVLELWQRRNEHSYALRKSFFERKLSAAETAVSTWYSISASLSALSALYEKVPSLVGKISGKTVESINNSYFAQIEKLSQSSDRFTNAIFLYFDFDTDTAKAKDPMKTIFQALAELQDLTISVGAIQDVATTSSDDLTQQFVQTQMQILMTKFSAQLKELSGTFNASQQDLNLMIRHIRNSMKKYDQ
jgi:predicted lipoprotein